MDIWFGHETATDDASNTGVPARSQSVASGLFAKKKLLQSRSLETIKVFNCKLIGSHLGKVKGDKPKLNM